MPEREERVDQAVAEYFLAREAGTPMTADELLARHPDIADELRSFLDAEGALRRTAPEETAAPPPEGPGLGTVRYFGDYELLGEIARGGMGVVYRARQVSLNRPVALKMVLYGQFAGPAEQARFRAEAEAAANLDHPNICPVHEVGEHDGQQYYSMKLLTGGGLLGRELTPQEAARLVALVARAVHHAHQRGVLHRDLKPSNILLGEDGTPYVTDFGLAKRMGGGAGLTETGAIVGTLAYMAPEQARAEKALTVAADVYSLGAVLYECLTGRPPFSGPNPLEVMLQVREKAPTPPREINREAPADLEAICLKCLEKQPEKRYASAAELADDLERWLRDEPTLARAVGPLGLALSWFRRNCLTAALVALVGTSAGLLQAVPDLLWWQVFSAPAQEPGEWPLGRYETIRMFQDWPLIGAVLAGALVAYFFRHASRSEDLATGASAGLVAMVVWLAVAGGPRVASDPAMMGVWLKLRWLADGERVEGAGPVQEQAASVRAELAGALPGSLQRAVLEGGSFLLLTVLVALYAGRVRRELGPAATSLTFVGLVVWGACGVLAPLLDGSGLRWLMGLPRGMALGPVVLVAAYLVARTRRLGCIFTVGCLAFLGLYWCLKLLSSEAILVPFFWLVPGCIALAAFLDGPEMPATKEGREYEAGWVIDTPWLKWRREGPASDETGPSGECFYLDLGPLLLVLWCEGKGLYWQGPFLLFGSHRGEPLIVPGTRLVVPGWKVAGAAEAGNRPGGRAQSGEG